MRKMLEKKRQVFYNDSRYPRIHEKSEGVHPMNFTNYEIKESGKDYVILPDGLEEEEYAIGFRKNDCALRDKVQSILSEMKADGTLGEISTNWFGSDITTVK